MDTFSHINENLKRPPSWGINRDNGAHWQRENDVHQRVFVGFGGAGCEHVVG